MEPKRRQLVLLVALLVALAGVVAYQYRSAPSPARSAASNVKNPAERPGAAPAGAGGVADVRLDALNADRPAPVGNERNLFRFKPKAAPPPPPPSPGQPGGPGGNTVNAPAVPAGPPPPPPIALKFIGLVGVDQAQKIAVLSDGRSVYQGREGDIIEGRYKILRIGAESIEMAYIDGRGRQTIRLTGS